MVKFMVKEIEIIDNISQSKKTVYLFGIVMVEANKYASFGHIKLFLYCIGLLTKFDKK